MHTFFFIVPLKKELVSGRTAGWNQGCLTSVLSTCGQHRSPLGSDHTCGLSDRTPGDFLCGSGDGDLASGRLTIPGDNGVDKCKVVAGLQNPRFSPCLFPPVILSRGPGYLAAGMTGFRPGPDWRWVPGQRGCAHS